MLCSPDLPPEILDLIVEHLHDDSATLKACSIVSKSWISRARSHLFFRVDFYKTPVEAWVKAFPDPSNSPAHYTRRLLIRSLSNVIAATTHSNAWICAFRKVMILTVETKGSDDRHISLAPLHELSPILKTLRIAYSSIPPPELFGLISSFPSVEDLTLVSFGNNETDVLSVPLTSPRFTGRLSIGMKNGIGFGVRQLLTFPGGLHFSHIQVVCGQGDVRPTNELVLACCNTLESFEICYGRLVPLETHPTVDLSAAAKLKKVELEFQYPSVLRISKTLRTIKSSALQQITIKQRTARCCEVGIVERFLSEWQELDHVLVQFWTSHSIRPKLVDGANCLKGLVPKLFPEITKRGLLDVV